MEAAQAAATLFSIRRRLNRPKKKHPPHRPQKGRRRPAKPHSAKPLAAWKKDGVLEAKQYPQNSEWQLTISDKYLTIGPLVAELGSLPFP